MSVMGTGVAAGVAQSAHNAQQVARQEDKRRSDANRASREVRDRYEHLLQDLEEGEDAGTVARLTIDDQVPQHEQQQQQPEEEQEQPSDARAPLADLAAQPDAMALRQRLTEQRDAALFRHLDVEA